MNGFVEKMMSLDIYATEPKLRINNSDTFSTNLGVVLSYFSVITMFVCTIYFGLSLWDVSNPQITYSIVNVFNPEEVNLTNEEYGFAFGLEDPVTYNYFIDESIYRAEAYQVIGKRAGTNTTFIWDRRKLELEACNIRKFPKSYESIMGGLPMKSLYCLKEPTFSLFGTFLNPSYSYIMLKLYECRNQTDSPTVCKPKKEIDKILTGTFFSFAFTDITIDPTNYTDPDKKFAGDSYTTISNKFFKEIHHYQKKVLIQTDVGWLTSQKENKTYIQSDYIKEMVDFRQMDNFLDYTFKLSTKEETYVRTYVKLQDIIAYIGGIIEFIMIFCQVILMYYNKSRLYQHLANELFYISKEKHNISKEKGKINKDNISQNIIDHNLQNVNYSLGAGMNYSHNDLSNNNSRNPANNNKSDNILGNLQGLTSDKKKISDKTAVNNFFQLNGTNSRIYLNNFQNNSFMSPGKRVDSQMDIVRNQLLINRKSPFNLNFCNSFWSFVLPCCFRSNLSMSLFRKAIEEIEQRIDVVFILKNLYDINRLKYLFLNKDQMKLFKLPYKSKLILENTGAIKRRTTLFNKFDGKDLSELRKSIDQGLIFCDEKINKLKSAYLNVKNEKENEVSQKLLSLLNEEYKRILDINN